MQAGLQQRVSSPDSGGSTSPVGPGVQGGMKSAASGDTASNPVAAAMAQAMSGVKASLKGVGSNVVAASIADTLGKAATKSGGGKKDDITEISDTAQKSAAEIKKTGEEYVGKDSALGKEKSRLELDLTKGETPAEIAAQHNKNIETILKDRTKLAEEQVAAAGKLSKWYEGLNKSYEDIASRYNEAIVGLGDTERTQMQGQAQQDYGAMSALGARAASMPGQGRMQTGAQQQLQQAAGAQAASSAYSASQDRIAAIDQQRRQMQYAVTGASMQQEVTNKQAGYGMESGMMKTQFGIQDASMSDRMSVEQERYGASSTGYDKTLSGVMNIGKEQYNVGMGGIEAQYNADVYAPTARMAQKTANTQQTFAQQQFDYQQQYGQQALDIQRQQMEYQTQGQNPLMSAFQGGVAGAGAGAAIGGPYGAAVGGFGGAAVGLFSALGRR